MISILVAVDNQGGIGKDNRIPWRAPADLKQFKELTMGHHILMGRKTWESIGRPLPGRHSIVLSRNPTYQADKALLVHSLEEGIEIATEKGDNEIFIIGGAEIFRQALPLCDQIYQTQVHTDADCDVYFPPLDLKEWDLQEQKHYPADERNPFKLTFSIYIRKRTK